MLPLACEPRMADLLPLQKLVGRWRLKSPADEWLDALLNAVVFEDWEHAALQLDNIKELNLW